MGETGRSDTDDVMEGVKGRQVEQLQSGLEHRAPIEQANGVLIAEDGIDAATARRAPPHGGPVLAAASDRLGPRPDRRLALRLLFRRLGSYHLGRQMM